MLDDFPRLKTRPRLKLCQYPLVNYPSELILLLESTLQCRSVPADVVLSRPLV